MALKGTEKATIDVCMAVITTYDTTPVSYQFDTASKVDVELQSETQAAVKLVVKGQLKAQKPEEVTVTGNKITLTDNVFIPEVVQIMQGGTITYDTVDTDKITGYTPPVVGSADKGKKFKLEIYSAVRSASGEITEYEKITYPNCTAPGTAMSSADGSFRAPAYVINSAPNTGEPPFDLDYVSELPTVTTP